MKNKIAKERVIYNNYDLQETYPDKEIIDMLMENGIDEDEITEEMIWQERYDQNEFHWSDTKSELKDFQ